MGWHTVMSDASHRTIRANPYLGDTDGEDLNAGGVAIAVLLQALHEAVVDRVEEIDVDFLQRVLRAELVQLVVDLGERAVVSGDTQATSHLVVDPRLVVVDGVVLHRVPGVLLPEAIHHLHFLRRGEKRPESAMRTSK